MPDEFGFKNFNRQFQNMKEQSNTRISTQQLIPMKVNKVEFQVYEPITSLQPPSADDNTKGS